MALGSAIERTGARVVELGKALFKTPGAAWSNASKGGAAAAEFGGAAAKGGFNLFTWPFGIIANGFKWSAKLALNILALPVEFVVHLFNGGVGAATGFVTKRPLATMTIAGAGALAAGGAMVHDAAAKRTQQSLMAQAGGMSYKNTVTPQEYANMQAAMAAGKDGAGTSFANNENDRAAANAEGVQAPKV